MGHPVCDFAGGMLRSKFRSHGDPFPLCQTFVQSVAEDSGVFFPQRASWSACALNTLALHGSNSSFAKSLHSSPPVRSQVHLAQKVRDCLIEAGEPPGDLSGQSALSAMAGSKSLYEEEPRNIAQYEHSKVKVLHSKLRPRKLEEVLPPFAKSVLKRFATLIEKPRDDCDDVALSQVTPYWDPKLKRSPSEMKRLLVGLANQGLVTFRSHIKEEIALFFVKKKTPEWIRMVIDARRVNLRHTRPPCTRLATPRAFLDIQFPASQPDEPLAYGIEADVNDCFYNFFSEELASWFGIRFPLTVGQWVKAGWKPTDIYDDSTGLFFKPNDDLVVFPVFRGLCMGWSWSLHFANEAVCHIVSGRIERPLQEIRDRNPAPCILQGPITGVYVDNISIIARTKPEAAEAAGRVANFFEQADIPLTWTTTEPVSVFTTVGVILDFKAGVIRNKPNRLWRAFAAGRGILRRKRVPTKLLEIWLGHMTSLFMLTPHALSAFFHIYRYIEQHRHHRHTIWSNVRHEIRTSLGLLWMARSNLAFDPVMQVDVGDSSTSAYALMTTWCTFAEIAHLCKWREVWRFSPMPEVVRHAIESGSRENLIAVLNELTTRKQENGLVPDEIRAVRPFGAGLLTQYAEWLLTAQSDPTSWLRTSPIKSQMRSKQSRRLEVDVSAMVPPIPDSMCQRPRYTLLWRKRWRDASAHINVKEARVALSSLRRTARVGSLHGKIKITLTDNIAALCSFERGRSSSVALNRVCRQASALQFAASLRWRLRHVETARNPSDHDSRFDSAKARSFRKPLVSRNYTGVQPDVATTYSGQPTGNSASSKTPCKSRHAFHGAFLEVFAGTARLSEAVERSGAAVFTPVDISFGSHHDLKRRATQLAILAWLKSGWIRFVHIATPCTVFSRARHNIRNLVRAQEKERTGIELAIFTAELIFTCNRFNILWSLENPWTSRLFEVPVLSELLGRPGVRHLRVDFCRYGEKFKKPTAIFTNCHELDSLQRQCNHQKHEQVLRGSENIKVAGKSVSQPKTKRAGAYPFELCGQWARIIRPLLDCHDVTFHSAVQQWDNELKAAAKTPKVVRRQAQAADTWDFLTNKFHQRVGLPQEIFLFGQHSSQEVGRRRKKQAKTKIPKPETIFAEKFQQGCRAWHPGKAA